MYMYILGFLKIHHGARNFWALEGETAILDGGLRFMHFHALN